MRGVPHGSTPGPLMLRTMDKATKKSEFVRPFVRCFHKSITNVKCQKCLAYLHAKKIRIDCVSIVALISQTRLPLLRTRTPKVGVLNSM
jgi:hypothetical protein